MNIIKSTGTFSFFVLISRVLGYVRDFFIALYLGSGPLADAFFVAFRIPNTFRRLFSEGTFNSAFVPSYSSELIKGKDKAKEFANSVFNLLVFFLLVTTILIEIFMPGFVKIIAPGFSDDNEKMQLAINLTRLTFPFLLFISLASFLSAILNSHNKFAAAAAAPIILNILLILCLIIISINFCTTGKVDFFFSICFFTFISFLDDSILLKFWSSPKSSRNLQKI